MTTSIKFAPGCYGDGTFGHQHTRQACAAALQSTYEHPAFEATQPEPETVDELYDALHSPMSDDAWEEDAACDWLNDHAPRAGHYWGWRDGDFGLWPEED